MQSDTSAPPQGGGPTPVETSNVTAGTGEAPGAASRTNPCVESAAQRERTSLSRLDLPPGGVPGAGEAPGLAHATPGATPDGEAAHGFGDRSTFTSREWGAWASPAGGGTFASPTQDRMDTDNLRGAPLGGVPAVGGSSSTAMGTVPLAAFRQMLTEVVSPISARLEKVEGSISRSGRRTRRRPHGYSQTSSSSEASDVDPERRGARRLSASTHRRVARVLSPGRNGEPERVIPLKIIPDDDTFKGILDCESYALANKSVRYDEEMAHGLGRKRKEISLTFGRDALWDGTPPLGVFEFLNRFRKASDDNDLSEGRAMYLLPEFTKGELKKELLSLIPSKAGGRAGEVTSYLELVNWLLRSYADEEIISSQVAAFNNVAQEEDETETAFYRRVRDANALCGYIHTASQLKGRFMQGVWWEVRTDVREFNTPDTPIEALVRYAQRKGDICRRRNEELRAQWSADAAERRARRNASKGIAAGVATTPSGSSVPSLYGGKAKVGTDSGRERLNRYPCLACNSHEHFTRHCPDLSVETRAKFEKARKERARIEGRTPRGTAGTAQPVAVVTEGGPSGAPKGGPGPQGNIEESEDSSSEDTPSSKND